jgi:thiamine-phosphate pyrophosphorylase
MGKETASVIDRFKAARLYVITTPPAGGMTYEHMVAQACLGGADVIQFRDKALAQRKDRFDLAARLRAICQEHGALFIVNDYLEVAMACEADGVHLGQDDMETKTVQTILHQNGMKNFLIGRSTHSLEQAQKAEQEGADYIGIGPVFATPTKPAYEPIGLELVRQVTGRVQVPHVAIGGIESANVDQVLEAGAQRVAVVRAVCGAPDIAQAARELKHILLSSPAVSGRGSMDSPPVAAGNDIRAGVR